MLNKVKSHYEENHQQNKLSYYEEYLDLLQQWCDHYGIETTNESIEVEQLIEEEILSLKYPTTRSLFLEK
jgi:hypothetical protein